MILADIDDPQPCVPIGDVGVVTADGQAISVARRERPHFCGIGRITDIEDTKPPYIGVTPDRHDPTAKVADVTETLGGPIGKLGRNAWITVTGLRNGAPAGSPLYQRFLIDYIYYRYGRSSDQ